MTDPYASLARQLTAAAERQDARRQRRRWSWRVRRLPALAIAALLVLVGGAVAIAATGLLEGSPVAPETTPSPVAGNGLAVAHQPSALVVSTADPEGGLQWGMRVFHTTRGQVCMQVGRVEGSQIGELGTEGAFGNDGRFHAIAADVLPPGYGGSSAQVECLANGRTLIFEDTHADRNALRLLPSEFPEPHRHGWELPPTADQRTLAYGLLGPNAVSVTFRTPSGLKTVPVSGPEGAFLIVEPAGYLQNPSMVGGSILGEASATSVQVTPGLARSLGAVVTATTFRFGTRTCSQGSGAPVQAACPYVRNQPQNPRQVPTRNLHEPIRLTLVQQSSAACHAAFLLEPCYKGEVEFQAPYAVTSAGSDYTIQGFASCNVGGKPETGWSLERNVAADETIHTLSLGLFVVAPSCAAHEGFEVRYGSTFGASGPAQPPAILGSVRLSEATIPHSG
jgi:hypothetical protein